MLVPERAVHWVVVLAVKSECYWANHFLKGVLSGQTMDLKSVYTKALTMA